MNNQAFSIPSTPRSSVAEIEGSEIAYGLWLEEPAGSASDDPCLRDITLSWLRFGYQGPVFESNKIETILDRALAAGFKACFIQRPGNVIAEDWMLPHWRVADFFECLKDAFARADFLVCADVVETEDLCALDTMCFLVNLQQYQALGRPGFDIRSEFENGPFVSGQEAVGVDDGSGFIEASRKNDLALPPLPENLSEKRVRLVSGLLNEPIGKPDSGKPDPIDDKGLKSFIEGVDAQISRGRNGVFLWNIESYDDLSDPEQSAQSNSYVSDLFCVAAGFKPNKLLQHHGCNEKTRVTFFDYSLQALTIRKTMIDEWDGADYPQFCRKLMGKFPSDSNFYQLWNGLQPLEIDWEDVQRLWEAELSQWGGARNFKDQWMAHKSLNHEFIHCDLLSDPKPLMTRIQKSAKNVIWWSNAFFTISSNWLFSIDRRRQLFGRWIENLAAHSPECQLYGADYNNAPVNNINAAQYLKRLKEYSLSAPRTELSPLNISRPLRF